MLGTLEFLNGPSYGADIVRSVSLAWLIASVFATAIAILTGWFMSRQVTRPVLALESATRLMEQGNLSARVNLQKEKQLEFTSLANSFNGMAEQVEQTVSTLRAFVADAAHELHTPLTALQANLELAREEPDESAQADYLTRAQEQVQRLEALVHNLLDLSRIEAADTKSDFAPVDINQLAREVGELFASRAEQSERTFMMNLAADDSVMVYGIESQLRQVIANLLENALKFTPIQGKISLSLEQTRNEVSLTVSDSGIGIPPEDLPFLFKRFHRARNASSYPGNGLGLAIVKAIVTLHRGSIQVQSSLTQGTDITITLPRAYD
jgi:signal transduction histidine kinase